MVVRTGDSFSFDLLPSDVPFGTPIWLPLASVAAPTLEGPEDYHAVLTARVSWRDPVAPAVPRTLALAFDVDGFDAAGAALDWDSQIHVQINRSYVTTPDAQHDQPLVAQGTMEVPAGARLKLMLLDQSGGSPPATPVRLEECRIVFVAVASIA